MPFHHVLYVRILRIMTRNKIVNRPKAYLQFVNILLYLHVFITCLKYNYFFLPNIILVMENNDLVLTVAQ